MNSPSNSTFFSTLIASRLDLSLVERNHIVKDFPDLDRPRFLSLTLEGEHVLGHLRDPS